MKPHSPSYLLIYSHIKFGNQNAFSSDSNCFMQFQILIVTNAIRFPPPVKYPDDLGNPTVQSLLI